MQIRPRFLRVALVAGAVAATALMPAAASAEPVVAISGANTAPTLSFFDTAKPLDQTKLALTGIPAGETVEDLDVRPATGTIYIVTTEDADNGGGLPDTARLYSINATTGAATAIGAPFSTTLTDGANLSIDFNPAVDRLRVVATTGENLRVNPADGAVVVDTAISGAPSISGVAYDRSVVGTTSTTLFGLDPTADTLVTIGGVNGAPSPNGGVVIPVGALGFDTTGNPAFDISATSNIAYFVGGNAFPGDAQLHTVNLATGAATKVANLDAGTYGLAVLPASTIALATNAQNAEERSGRVEVGVVRTGSTLLGGSVDFATADGTAKAGSDYTATSGTLRFAPGETTKTIVIPVIDDGTGDAKETFTVQLTNVAGSTLGTSTSTITTVETTTGDKTAPGLVLSDLGLKANRYFSQFGLKTTYSCSEACKSVYTVRLGTSGSAYLAKGTGELRTTGVGVANAPITTLGKARLKAALAKSRASMIPAQFTIQVTDANGNKRITKRTFFILR